MSLRFTRLWFCALILLLCRAPLSRAEDSPADPPAEGPPSPFGLQVGVSYLAPATLHGSSGDVSRTTALGQFELGLPPVGEKLFPRLFVNGGTLQYDFSGRSELSPTGRSPWESIGLVGAGIAGFYAIEPKWGLIGAVNLDAAGESGADFSQALTGGGFVGVSHEYSKDLSLGFALLAQTRLEDNPIVIPIPSFEWKLPFDDQRRWTLFFGGQNAGPILGAGTGLSFQATRTLATSVRLSGFGIGGEFRLADDGPVPDGVGRDSALPLVVDVAWKPSSAVQLGAFAGVNLFGQLELLDSDGHRLARQRVEPSAMMGLRLSISF